ncbi:MAG: aminoglycoside phosphotransferase family protein [Candidatus Heimdallarchaeota archaeon]|nr:aminoglycoside phosphotransferase family protein [Candidatus Heimdallarchaeota archaeon]MDH5644454.1 aminoglycoside phosphotransferase family protein [Candidatus Heimdallarchaeota archaeon]
MINEELRGKILNILIPQLDPSMTLNVGDKIPGGWESDIYAITAEFNSDNLYFVVRVLKGENTTVRAEKEYQDMINLSEIGVSIPKLYGFGPSGETHNGFIIMEQILGNNMGELMLAGAPEEIQKQVIKMVNLHLGIQEKDWNKVTEANYDITANPRAFINSRLERYENKLQHSSFKSIIEPIIKKLYQVNVETTKLQVIHNDFHPFNILYRLDGTAVIIDWSGVDLGDARFDVAWTYLLISSFNRQLADFTLQVYFSQKPNLQNQFDIFIKLVCIRRLLDIEVIAASNIDLDMGSSLITNFISFAEEKLEVQLDKFKERLR